MDGLDRIGSDYVIDGPIKLSKNESCLTVTHLILLNIPLVGSSLLGNGESSPTTTQYCLQLLDVRWQFLQAQHSLSVISLQWVGL